jgi:DNA-binding MarR family transcriptional regulator
MTEELQSMRGAEQSRLNLEDYLPYRLSVAANSVSAIIARAYKEQFKLSVWEWRVIAVLGEESALTAQAICQKTAMDKVTVSRAISRLSQNNLVVRSTRESDRRSRNVELSEDGQRIYNTIVPQAIYHENQILRTLTSSERETLMTLLQRVQKAANTLEHS